ncbi:MAG TPA: carboxypeptidase regulatory-like domain-containing protein [Terriglobales bacterium]|nr:carboxypeptidase regulatory-like domain-containing protein [Terriglobales bacterium]
MWIAPAIVVTLTLSASAASLTGTVTNRTTNKPAAGAEVSLLALSQGMSQVGSTKTDAQGKFSFNVPEDNAMHLVRVTYQGVNYFPKSGPMQPGTTSTDIDVYDSAAKLEGISTTIQAMRIQSSGPTLDVTELYAVQNSSNPPRSLMSDATYTINLPEGAVIEQASASGPGGMPINADPVPGKEKGQYYFSFPLRPGETRFQVAYHMPYNGDATIRPRPADQLQHFAILLPNSMKFEGLRPGVYSPMPGQQGGSSVQVATGVKPGQDISFHISGTGEIADTGGPQQGGGGEAQGAEASQANGRPGGGLGRPEGTPDPLHDYRWGILGGLAALLVIGGVYTATRSSRSAQPAVTPKGPPATVASRQEILLEALKEELFSLELDRQQGRITPEEYAKSKAALDETLHRATARRK